MLFSLLSKAAKSVISSITSSVKLIASKSGDMLSQIFTYHDQNSSTEEDKKNVHTITDTTVVQEQRTKNKEQAKKIV